MLGHWMEEIKAGEGAPKGWVTPESPKSTPHPLPRALPNAQKGKTCTQGSLYDIYLYI